MLICHVHNIQTYSLCFSCAIFTLSFIQENEVSELVLIRLQKSLHRQTSFHLPLFSQKPLSLSSPFLLFFFCIISSKSPILYLSVALFTVSLMCWMISQNDVCPGILSCWTIQLNMIMLSTLTLLNTQVNEQFTVKCRNIWSHLHVYKQYLFFL